VIAESCYLLRDLPGAAETVLETVAARDRRPVPRAGLGPGRYVCDGSETCAQVFAG